MYRKTGVSLIIYGIVIDLLGLAGAMYDPVQGSVGFNSAAMSGVIAGGACGILSIVWGVLLIGGMAWARIAAIVTTALFTVAFGWRGVMAAMAYAGGDSAKWYAATIIIVMTLLSLGMFLRLLSRPAPAAA